METARKKPTSMSVLEMGRSLGLGKTESYWLIKKNYFKTITVGHKMRVMVDSFEDWYANQCRYQKVDGTPPGENIKKSTLSVAELGDLLGLAEASTYELIEKGYFEIVDTLGKRRISKSSFDEWYSNQSFYRTKDDQNKDKELIAISYSMPDIARMLGIHRNCVYYLLDHGPFHFIQVGRQKRVTKESFHLWAEIQSRYKISDIE